MFRLLAAALVVLPSVALAQTDAQPETPRKIRNVILYGDDKCPVASSDEVVVCARQPESERYRVPRRFRDENIAPQNQSWVNRTATADDVGRTAAGLPDTCSPVGTGGQTGCAMQAAQAAAAEKRARRQTEQAVP